MFIYDRRISEAGSEAVTFARSLSAQHQGELDDQLVEQLDKLNFSEYWNIEQD